MLHDDRQVSDWSRLCCDQRNLEQCNSIAQRYKGREEYSKYQVVLGALFHDIITFFTHTQRLNICSIFVKDKLSKKNL